MTSLYSQAAQATDGNGAGNAGTTGLHFTVSSAATLSGLWQYSPAGCTQLPATIALYNYSTQALITSNAASWSGAAGSGWVFAAFTSPPSLASGTGYMAAAFRNDSSNAWFCFLSTATWPKSSGILTAPADVSTGQGWYDNTDTTLHFPSSQLPGFNWYLDVEVSTGASHSASASLTVTPSLSAAGPRTRNRSASLVVAPSFGAAPAGRSPYTWPFSWDSPWNLPVSADAAYAPTGITVTSDYSTDASAVEYCCTDPAQPVKSLTNAELTGGSIGAAAVHVPPGMSAPGEWNDCAALLGIDGDTVYQGQTLLLSAGGNPQFGGTGNYPSATVSLKGTGITGAHGGSGLSALGGTLTVADLTGTGAIRHAMKVCFNGLLYYSSAGAGYQWPAVSADGGYSTLGDPNYYGGTNPLVVLGALLALPPWISPAKYADPLIRRIATAMQCYGAYIVDNTASGPGVPNAFISLNYDAAPYFAGTSTFSADFHQLLEDLQVITSSTSSTPGGGAIGSDRLAPYAPVFGDGTGAPPSVTVVSPSSVLMESLTDSFPGSSLSGQWGSYGTVSVSGRQAALSATTSESGIYSAAGRMLTGSHMLARVTPYTGGGGPYFNFQATVDGGTGGAGIQYNAGSLRAYTISSGGAVTTLASITYDATAHAWWRIRESAGTTYFDTSPDGSSWTNRWSAASPVAYDSMLAQAGAGTGSGTAGNAYVADFNVPPATRSASLTVTPAFSVRPAAGHARSAALVAAPRFAVSAARARGAQPGYPGGLVDAQVELFMGGAWVNVTRAALPDGQVSGTIKGGQADGSQQPAPASMQLVLDNPGYSYTPRNAGSPYFGQLRQGTPARVSVASVLGTRLRLEAGSNDRAYVNDVSALHVTGSLELRLGVVLSDWRGCVLAQRRDDSQQSWQWSLGRDGAFTFTWWDSGGAQHSVTSPSAAGVSWQAFRVTLDSSDGNVRFFLSDDLDGTWTPVGDGSSGTSGAATSIQAGNAPLVIGWSNNVSGSQLTGSVTGFRMYSGIGGSVVADAEFAAQLPGTTSWTDTAGRAWLLAGGAAISARDYRGHFELSALNPSADVSGGMARVAATLSGRLRRLQQGSAPAVESPIRRAVLAQGGALYPVGYWPMEDAGAARAFGAAAGSHLLTAGLGRVQAAADSSFEASGPLPALNGDSLSVTVDSYSGGSAWAVRFLFKMGTTLPSSGSVRLVDVATTGACAVLRVSVNSGGSVTFTGLLAGGATAFTSGPLAYPQLSGPAMWSVEATPSGSNVQYALVAVAPGASGGNTDPHVVTGHGSFGNVTSISVNPDLALDDSVLGHLQVQKAWASMFDLGQPLNAWRGELAADRFTRVCGEQGIPCRVLGRPVTSQAMGPQPRGSAWAVLKDCANTEQGIVFEPRDVFGLGFRTRESMGAQQPGVTLSFASSQLPGDLKPADDDAGFLNDVTGQDGSGTTWREVLGDGSPNSVSEPGEGGRGRYAGQVPFTLNVADPSELPGNVAFYLARVSADEPRYRNVVMDLGVPGAPAADIARLRPGDIVSVPSPSEAYQSADIAQLAMGWTEQFGPGRKVTWDCVPASPYTAAAGGGSAPAVAGAVLDTEGSPVLDTAGGLVLDTGA